MHGFNFATQVRVRNFEVDWQGIVHNANYLLYFEVGRIEYLRHVGIKVSMETITGDSKIVVARNEVDYVSPARFDELLDVYTRVSKIGNTSFVFEGAIYEAETQRLVAKNTSVHVWLDYTTDKPMRVPEAFRVRIKEIEG